MVHKIIEVGKSKAVVIPKAVLLEAGLDKGDLLEISFEPRRGSIVLQPFHKEAELDPRFARSLKRGLSRYRKVLKELAKR